MRTVFLIFNDKHGLVSGPVPHDRNQVLTVRPVTIQMALIRPFRALRPTPQTAASVAAVPYDVVSVDEARMLAKGNALNFLHVSRAEINMSPGTNPYADEVYKHATENFQVLLRSAPLVREEQPSLYVYRLCMGGHEQIGVAACYSLDEYDQNLIKKHETTRRDKEDDRTRHMLAIGAQTGIVFLTYRSASSIDVLVNQITKGNPLFDFEAGDAIRHTIWLVPKASLGAVVDAFAELPALYIADGHHRIASAARVYDWFNSQSNLVTPDGIEHDTFLGVAFPDNQVQILPYHRVVSDLAGKSPEAFLHEVSGQFGVREVQKPPRDKVAMYLAGHWYTISLDSVGGGRAASGDWVSKLAVSLLQDQILAPFLQIADVRTDKRISFIGGVLGTVALERAVQSGQAKAAFSMPPVPVRDLMEIADSGELMPPKSTWFEPKLRDGLLIHTI